MFKTLKAAIIIAAALSCGSAIAGSWNSDENLYYATEEAITDYVHGGVEKMEEGYAQCMRGVDKRISNPTLHKDVERCVARDMAGLVVFNDAHAANPNLRSEYFENDLTRFTEWMRVIEAARIVRLPEQFAPYLKPRMARVRDNVTKSFGPSK